MKMPQIHKYLSACYSCVAGISTKINFLPFQELSQLLLCLLQVLVKQQYHTCFQTYIYVLSFKPSTGIINVEWPGLMLYQIARIILSPTTETSTVETSCSAKTPNHYTVALKIFFPLKKQECQQHCMHNIDPLVISTPCTKSHEVLSTHPTQYVSEAVIRRRVK